MPKLNYIHSAKIPPSFVRWSKINEKVEGYNWDEINVDRKQCGREPINEVTKYS